MLHYFDKIVVNFVPFDAVQVAQFIKFFSLNVSYQKRNVNQYNELKEAKTL